MPSPPLPLVQSLSPRIAVLTSEDVVQSCEANGCRGLEELLRPWEGGTERVSILSSTLTPTIHPTFPLRFVSYASVYPDPSVSSPNPDMIVDLISNLVGARKPNEEQHYPLTRSLLLSSRPAASHETFNHPVGVVIAVSTSTPEPMAEMAKLYGRTLGPMAQAVPWLDGVTLMRFFVVVHDVSRMGEDLAVAHELLASVKKAYGPHSTLLVINTQIERREEPKSPDISVHPSIPIVRPLTPIDNLAVMSQVYASALSSLTLSPGAAAAASMEEETDSDRPRPQRRKLYAAKLSAEDTQRLAALVRELVVQSVVPWMEARIREWNEVWHANRRGITGRLFGAGRKLFSSRPSSPSPNAMQAGYNSVKGFYPATSIEGLTRRLGDFAFMLRDYKYAATVYDSLRRDSSQDKAWRYAAAATEMYGLSTLLSHSYFAPTTPPVLPNNPFTTLQHTEISSWLEQAVMSYQSRAPANQIQLDALRITVLYYEAWKMIGEWRGVGGALVRAAGDADEVPSAVLMEEAASAETCGGKSEKGRRRRAFNLVMAARRYETAGLKMYSRRCLDRASGLYRAAPWTAAQNRIEYSLGRQAYTLGESDIAVEHFLRLLEREDTGTPGSQGMVLEDMALAYEQLSSHPEQLAAAADKLHLPTPVFSVGKTRIVTTAGTSGSGSSQRWAQLEAQALNTWDRKGKKPASLLPDLKRVVAAVGETFHVELQATNPLNATLAMSDVTIRVDGATDDITIESIPEITLEPYETRLITLDLTATRSNTIEISSVSFMFHRFFPVNQPLQRKGKRLTATKEQRITPTYGSSASISVEIQASRPSISVELEGWPGTLYAGEETQATLRLVNIGSVAVTEIQLLASEPGMIRISPKSGDTEHNDTLASIPNSIISNIPLSIYPHTIEPGDTVTIPVTITGTRVGNIDTLALLLFSRSDHIDDTGVTTLSHNVEIQPLTRIQALARPMRGDADRYLLDLSISNASASNLEILEILSVGPVWESSASSQEHTGTLYPAQSSRHILNLQYDPSSQSTDLWQKDVSANLGRLVQEQPESVAQAVASPFEKDVIIAGDLLPAYIASKTSHRLAQLRQDFPAMPTETLQRIFPLFDPLDLVIIVRWRITGPTLRQGYTFHHSLRVAPAFSIVEPIRKEVDTAIASGGKQTRTMYEETGRLRRVLMDSVLGGVLAQEEDPITVQMSAGQKGSIEHDFTKGPCSVPVDFRLQNRSPVLHTRWVLRLPSASGQSSRDVYPSPAIYSGNLIHQGSLEPRSSVTHGLSIWSSEPSLVSLGGWELDVETGEMDGEIWVPRRSWSRVGRGGMLDIRQIG